MYICKICKEEFEESSDAQLHIAYAHNLIEDTEHPDGLTREDFPPEFQGLIDEIDRQSMKKQYENQSKQKDANPEQKDANPEQKDANPE